MPQFTQHTLRSLVRATAHDIAEEVEMAAHLEVYTLPKTLWPLRGLARSRFPLACAWGRYLSVRGRLWRVGRAPMAYYPEFARAVVEAIEEMMKSQ